MKRFARPFGTLSLLLIAFFVLGVCSQTTAHAQQPNNTLAAKADLMFDPMNGALPTLRTHKARVLLENIGNGNCGAFTVRMELTCNGKLVKTTEKRIKGMAWGAQKWLSFDVPTTRSQFMEATFTIDCYDEIIEWSKDNNETCMWWCF